MKKFVVALFSILTACFLFTSMAKNNLVSVKGHINYYGNAPFAIPAFKTDEGKVYLMEVDKSSKLMIEEILSHQGEHLELTGEIENIDFVQVPVVAADGILIISRIKPLL